MPRRLLIDGKEISDDSDCYVIAEIGHNHQGDLEKCRQLIHAAVECGVDAVKLQKRDNKTLYTQQLYDSIYDNRNSYGPTYGAHREFLEFGRQEYLELKQYCQELKVTFFATAFDVASADFLAELDVPAYKIASGDLTNIPLIRHVAAFGKPVILSTGGGTMEDVQRAHDAILPINPQVCIMQCTSGYPPEYHELNLRVIETFRNTFPEVVVGYSGHDNGIAMPLVAYMLGSRVVEKHFTLNRAWKGTDQGFSMAPDGMRRMVRDLHRARMALGDGLKRTLEVEKAPLRKMAKKLVAGRDLPAGHRLTGDDIQIKSPGDGLPPYLLDQVLGQVLLRPLQADEDLRPADLQANG